ncbi:hypothetical protein J2Z40_000374 [Cytobacillus eiseniae]|uniref:DUF4129 domain-containing protein n=1 Tax=Cytobacillus eiseniae TaxID=762947 RepID=A0ABS4RA91_9BACI|nr:hypothetical protein [Cytobacillus eiseniae]MBP2239821.1 hypothetical protein [Cytobacillus eiseniae]
MMNERQASDELEAILNRNEYTAYYDDSKGLLATWWEKAKEWFADLLSDLFPSIAPTSAVAGPILIGILAVVVITLCIMAGLFFRNRRRSGLGHEHKPLQALDEINWSYQKHLSEAQALEASGNYTLSTRHLFLALLLYFHEKEWLVARIWKTNWEYYDELRKVNHQWAERFFHLALLFDEVTYGEHIVAIEEFTQYKSTIMRWLRETETETETEQSPEAEGR